MSDDISIEVSRCDMCGTPVLNGKCSCGTWKSNEEMANNPMKLALEQFNEMKQFTLTGDAPHLGCAFVFFRGNYKDCQRIKKIIYEMNGRKYYDE